MRVRCDRLMLILAPPLYSCAITDRSCFLWRKRRVGWTGRVNLPSSFDLQDWSIAKTGDVGCRLLIPLASNGLPNLPWVSSWYYCIAHEGRGQQDPYGFLTASFKFRNKIKFNALIQATAAQQQLYCCPQLTLQVPTFYLQTAKQNSCLFLRVYAEGSAVLNW